MKMDMNDLLRNQLVDRRQKLEAASEATKENPDIVRLIGEVDSALKRMDDGTYGLCQVCHEPIEADRLIADPLAQFCLDHLTLSQQRALEDDLQLASKIQKGLLPKQNFLTIISLRVWSAETSVIFSFRKKGTSILFWATSPAKE
jgi:RNA polymerase-binding transcription factor DksA